MKAIKYIAAIAMVLGCQTALAQSQCESVLMTALPGEAVIRVVQDLAKMKMELDKFKTGQTKYPALNTKLFENKFQERFKELLKNPSVNLSATEIKSLISSEIARLQQAENRSQDQEQTLRAEQAEVLKPYSEVILRAPPATEKEVETEYQIVNAMIAKSAKPKIPWASKFKIFGGIVPRGAILSSPPLTTSNLLLVDLHEKFLEPFGKAEILDAQGIILGESTAEMISRPLNMLRSALNKAQGESLAAASFLKAKKVSITLISKTEDGRTEINKEEMQYFTEIKHVLESLEFTDVAVEGSVIFTTGQGPIKRSVLIPSTTTAANGDYKTSVFPNLKMDSGTGDFFYPLHYGMNLAHKAAPYGEYRINDRFRNEYEQLLVKYGL